MREPITHEVKTVQPHFDAVWTGLKAAEARRLDRDYQVGDTLVLREWDPETCSYPGPRIVTVITHVLRDEDGPWLAPGHGMLSLRLLELLR